eukprot:CAMPEP_0172156576 /NCGR_PEP_ID=MMETSP1050-20130122/3292_1 /TAXON_ID=233186 /ORGANISM="Cryptomonas curvata, Strain CCAP979/52" /LENGTH=51 /DNA_ID=CAMNT_0012825669 /DNA_START=107 /DNA_END=262 /DNA_ORIENTATION=-
MGRTADEFTTGALLSSRPSLQMDSGTDGSVRERRRILTARSSTAPAKITPR